MVPGDAKAKRSRIFISYRRKDTEQAVGRLTEDLREHFASDQVFQDVTGIAPGADFADALHEALDTCAAMLVVIGPDWVNASDDQGRRRLDLEDDWVRQEVAESLRRPDVRVFPLLVETPMPSEEDLPADLKGLVRRQALSLTVRHWRYDLAELVGALKQVPGLATPAERPRRTRNPVSETADSLEGARPMRAAGDVSGREIATDLPQAAGAPVRTTIPWKLIAAFGAAIASAFLLFKGLDTAPPPALVKGMEPSIVVGQFYGAPIVLATLHVENAGSSIATIDEVRGKLTGPSSTVAVTPVSWTIVSRNGPFAPVVGPFPFTGGMKADLRVVMAPDVNLPPLLQRLTELPEYRQQPPCVPRQGGTPPLTNAAFEMVQAFAEGRFAWRAGEWRLDVDVATESRTHSFHHAFSLSADEVQQLRQSIALLRQCLAVNTLAPFGQDGAMASFLAK